MVLASSSPAALEKPLRFMCGHGYIFLAYLSWALSVGWALLRLGGP